jgi:predicted dehydrogenase
VETVYAARVGEGPAVRDDKMSIVLSFRDGSVGAINYFANGCKRYPKETLEVFSDGRVLRLENFRVTRAYGFKSRGVFRTRRQDKGHAAEIRAFVDCVTDGGEQLIPYDELVNVTEASMTAVDAARENKVLRLGVNTGSPPAETKKPPVGSRIEAECTVS